MASTLWVFFPLAFHTSLEQPADTGKRYILTLPPAPIHTHILPGDTASCLWTPHISTADLLTPGNPILPTKEKSYVN